MHYWGGVKLDKLSLIAPLGISFYTFQALGYLFDVYYKRIKAEKNWWDYMLFVSFFPQLLSGPISKAKDLLPQIKSDRYFDGKEAIEASKMIIWGMFLKVAMADRLGLFVDVVFPSYEHQSGLTCLLASIFYTFQIYGDFAGYSLMAMGTGKLMGFKLINNFNSPYLAISITDFWRRWHISLSTWLKDYVYIPLGGSRCSKLRTYWNIFVTFLISGIWHGANWTFIVWGILHGGAQIIEKAMGWQKCDNRWATIPRVLLTFFVVNFAWILFRSPDISAAWGFIGRMFIDNRHSLTAPLGAPAILYIFPILLVMLKDILNESKMSQAMVRVKPFVRMTGYAMLTCYILLFGVLDSGSFIYVSF